MDSILSDKGRWLATVRDFWGDDTPAFGNCYMSAVVLCSALRSSGIRAEECYVAISCHRGEDYGRATHAVVLASYDKTWFMLDATKDDGVSGLWVLPSLEWFSERNRLICLFNDQCAFLITGDGILIGDAHAPNDSMEGRLP